MIQDKVSITFSGHKKEWDNFRLVCKLRDTNASYELRRYINRYINNNMDLLIEYEQNQEELKEMFLNGELD